MRVNHWPLLWQACYFTVAVAKSVSSLMKEHQQEDICQMTSCLSSTKGRLICASTQTTPASGAEAGATWKRRDDREWDGWVASPTLRTWVWASSRRWWRTGRPGVLQSTGSQWVGHDWATEQQPPPLSSIIHLGFQRLFRLLKWLPAVREMQIKTIKRYHLVPVRMAVTKKTKHN